MKQNKKLSTSLVASLLIATTTACAKYDITPITITSASKTEQSIKDVTANVEVITKEEIEEKRFTTVSEALSTLPGVSTISNGGIGQLDSLFIRGIDTKRILVLVDGIRYNEPTGLSGAPLAQLMINDIERIEVVKGSQSGIWGADASGGIINIITSNSKKGFHGNALIEAGSFNTRKYIASINNRTENYYIKFNANRVSTDGYSSFEAKKSSPDYGKRWDDLGLERDGYSNNTYNILGGINLNQNNQINFLYKNIDSEYDYDNSNSDNKENKTYLNHYFKLVDYKYKNSYFSTKLAMSQGKFDRRQGDTFHTKSIVNEFLINTNISYLKNSNLMFGLNKQNFEDEFNEQKYQTEAVFISNNTKLGKFNLTQVLRYDNNNAFDEKITGKIGIKYNFNKDFYISSNYGTAYNAPTLGNLSYTPSLEPETTKSFDLNLAYKGLTFTYFENKIENMINYTFVPSFQYLNEDGISRFKGYELSYKKDILDDTFLSLNYTHLSAKDANGETLSRRAKRELGFSLDYYGFNKLHLNLNGSYIGDRFDDKVQTGRYTLFNSVINYSINDKTKLYLKLDNITDKYYQTVDGYATAGRSAYVGLKVSF